MKSPGIYISPSRSELVERLATVRQASRELRAELALSVCESSEMRIASRQLRMESRRAVKGSAAGRKVVYARGAQQRLGIAQAVARILSQRGYPAFVMTQPKDSATFQ
jgi:hypothetical protein